MRIFLPWTSPMLPAVAARLLADSVESSPDSMDADLSGLLMVVRGRNAGRRLLALLAAESQRRSRALIPPRIITPGVMDSILFKHEETAAGRLVQRLAWDAAVKQVPVELLDQIWQSPVQQDRSLVLSRFLDQTWQELSTSGADFSQAYRELEKIAPEVADREGERWNGLQSISEVYRDCLQSWGLSDPAEVRFCRMRDAAIQTGLCVVLAGVVELAPVLVRLLARLSEEPLVFIHAPESESSGFDKWGRLIPSHWEKRPCRFIQGEVHVVADAAQQAVRCADIVLAWQQDGLPASAITLAVPEPEALPILDQTLRDRGIAARRAEGQSAAHTAAVRLLTLAAECLGPAPLYSAVADLVRHPDLEKILGHSTKRLDEYFNEHLPWRLDLASGDEAEHSIAELLVRIRKLTWIQSETFADDVTRFLLEIYGERRLNRHGTEDRALLHALEAIRNALDARASRPRNSPMPWSLLVGWKRQPTTPPRSSLPRSSRGACRKAGCRNRCCTTRSGNVLACHVGRAATRAINTRCGQSRKAVADASRSSPRAATHRASRSAPAACSSRGTRIRNWQPACLRLLPRHNHPSQPFSMARVFRLQSPIPNGCAFFASFR